MTRPALASAGSGERPALWERVFLIAALSIYNAIPFLVGDQPEGAEALNPVKALEMMSTHGDSTKQTLLLSLYLMFIIVTLKTTRWQEWSFFGIPLALLTVWVTASILWSIDPGVTLRRSAAMWGTVILGMYMGLRFDVPTMLRMMSWVIGIVLIASIAVAFIWPNLGIDFEGRLRGVTAHKNMISAFASVSFLMLIVQLTKIKQDNLGRTFANIALAVLCIVCMLWSKSAAALPVLLLSLPVLPLVTMLRKADRSITAAIPLLLGLAVVLVALAIVNYEVITQSLGKDSDMSGRTKVWQYAIGMLFVRPWFGYGFGTFWEGSNSPGGVFWSLSGLGIPHSHNGYLQLALDAGVIGLGLFFSGLFILVYRISWLIRYGDSLLACFAAAYLALFLICNVPETRLWIGNSFDSKLFVYIVVLTNLEVWRTWERNKRHNENRFAYVSYPSQAVT